MKTFDQSVCRRGTGSYKWDDDASVDYPLWVADMDFEACPAILDALRKRVEHGVFGYSMPTDTFYEAIIGWHRSEHNVFYRREWMLTVPGIVPAISAILRALTSPGEGVLLFSPAYNCFYSSIRNLQCRAEESRLILSEGRFQIDFDDLEARASLPDVRVMLLCSPHNPTGRVWTKEELTRVSQICLKHGVTVVADEIHCELTMPGQTFLPYASLGEEVLQRAIICTSASKAFNIAGLQNAQMIIADSVMRRQVDRAVNIHEVCDVNPIGIVATEAAYTGGKEWLVRLRQYIYDNYLAVSDYLSTHLPMLTVFPLEATYLLWVDISAITDDDKAFCSGLCKEKHVRFAPGSHYGTGGEGHIRINLATQRTELLEAMRLLKSYIHPSE